MAVLSVVTAEYLLFGKKLSQCFPFGTNGKELGKAYIQTYEFCIKERAEKREERSIADTKKAPSSRPPTVAKKNE